jgi:hypothetical protein
LVYIKNYAQHRLPANSGQFGEKCYFRHQVTNNKADKNVSLLHATCLNQDRWQQLKKIKKMKTFYLKTDKFWIISRIIFTILFIAALIKLIIDLDFEPQSLVAYSLFGIYISFMIIMLVKRALKKPISSIIKMTTGIISLLFGFLMSYTILIQPNNYSEFEKIGFLVFPIWIVLFGLRDILFYKNNFKVKQTIINSI